MVTTEDVNVLERPVGIRGGHPIGARRGSVSAGLSGPQGHSGHGYSVGWSGYTTGTAVVELRPHGPGALVEVAGFDTHEAARAEFERIKAELFTREWVTWATTTLAAAGVVPDEFRGQLLAGEPQALLVAADWQDERDRPNAALLLRSAYHRVRGEANVEVKAGKGATVVLNPERLSKRTPAAPKAGGELRAAVVEEGKRVRIVSVRTVHERDALGGRFELVTRSFVEERIFRVGDQAQFDSYNLSYYGPIRSVTAKTVVVVTDRYREGATARMPLAKFVSWNHNFDLAQAQERNANWSD